MTQHFYFWVHTLEKHPHTCTRDIHEDVQGIICGSKEFEATEKPINMSMNVEMWIMLLKECYATG